MRGPLVLIATVLLGVAAFVGVSRYPGASELPEPAPVVADEGAAVAVVSDLGSELPTVRVFKAPTCGCCGEWITHLRQHGFEVEAIDTNEMMAIKAAKGIVPAMGSCHTAEIGDYFVEGHVPAEAIASFMADAPAGVLGLTVPGMPIGSPGMEVPSGELEPYEVVTFDKNGKTGVFAKHN